MAVGAAKQSAKKEREPLGNVVMMCWTRGALVDGHVELQALAQRCSLEESAWSWEHVLAMEARAGPSRRVRMWVWIMSECTAEIVVVAVAVAALGSPEVQAMAYIIESKYYMLLGFWVWVMLQKRTNDTYIVTHE